MRILVIGAGVLGCNVAANLYKAGNDVTLLARGKWYETIKRNGLQIKNMFQPRTKSYHISVIDKVESDDIYDFIFVSLRFTQLSTVYKTLLDNKTKNIVFNGNNTRVHDTIEALPDKNILFSFSLSAGKRGVFKVNSIDLKKITYGGLKESEENRKFVESVHEAFKGSGYNVVYEKNMEDYLLSHAAFVVPVAFACYHTGGNLRQIRNDKDYLKKIVCANIETYAALETNGHEILPKEDQKYRTDKWFKTVYLFYKLMSATPLGRICASDHAMSAADEMQALAIDMKAEITKAGTKSVVFDELWEDIKRYL